MPPELLLPASRSHPASAPETDLLTDAGLILLTLIWGANFVVVKFGLEAFTPLAFNALRFPLGCAVLWMAVRASGPLPRIHLRDVPALVALGVLGNFVYQLLFIYGLNATRAGNAALLLATVPVWALLFSALAREGTVDRLVVGGILATFVGMALVVAGGQAQLALDRSTLRGDALMLLAAASWAGYTVGARGLIVRYGAVGVTAWTLWIGAVLLVIVGLPDLRATAFRAVSLEAWGTVLFAGVMALGVAYLIWYRAVHRLGSARTAAYSNFIPVVALGLAWVFLDEVLSVVQMAGAAVVLAGIVMARWGATPRRRKDGTESAPGRGGRPQLAAPGSLDTRPLPDDPR